MNRRNIARQQRATKRGHLLDSLVVTGLAMGLTSVTPTADAVEIMAAAQVLADTTDGMLNEVDSQTVPDPVGAAAANKQAGIGVLGGVAHATTGLGWIRLSAFSDSIVPPPFADGYLDAIAVGEFVDEITITPTNPALLNQPGTATFAYHVEGIASTGGRRSGVQAGVNVPNQPMGNLLLVNEFYGDPVGENFDETKEFDYNFTFGQPFELRVMMFARARVEVDNVATFAEVDLGNTFEWMGTIGIVDQSQVEVTDYNITSASSTDYRNAITAPHVEPIPGDFNDDGTVDAADYTVWRDGLGEPYTQAEYTSWKNNFGATSASLQAGSSNSLGDGTPAAVPEPAAWLLLAGTIAWGFARRRFLGNKSKV